MSITSLFQTVFGRPIPSSQDKKEKLTVLTGVPVLGLDSLASTGYGPEAALTVLAPLGAAGLHAFPAIIVAVVALLTALYFSYRQTSAAYPNGGGAYIVAKDNLGASSALVAAVALLLDYLLNVAVAISAGVGAMVSAIPFLQPHTLVLCLIVLLMLMVVNLRGIRESGVLFTFPVLVFITCMTVTIGLGLFRLWQSSGHPLPVVRPPVLSPETRTASLWLLLTAFANGCTAMTGIEAVSNGVPLFRRPTVPRAQKTLTVIVGVLGLFLLGLAWLCPAYQIGAMNEQQPGYQTILSQLVAAVGGHGTFYYISLASIFIVLTYSAQTSFTDFPRVCRLLAEDKYLPVGLAERGRRLVFSYGIIILTLFTAVLLVIFDGVTNRLIPLFAVGAFSAFLFSQIGMVRHWLRKGGGGSRIKVFFNGLGATTTAAALVIIVAAKFAEGAWAILVIAPALVFLLSRINRHYRKISRQVDQALPLQPPKSRRAAPQPPVIIIPVANLDRVTEKAIRFGLMLSDDIIAVHVCMDSDEEKKFQELWDEKIAKQARAITGKAPHLETIHSPYRKLDQPILDYTNAVARELPDRIIAVLIPELAEPHWWGYLLHNWHGARLTTLFYLNGNERVTVIRVPWHLRE
jgi:amino acid transporter